MLAPVLRKLANLQVEGPLDGVTLSRWLGIVLQNRQLSVASKHWLLRLTLISLRNSALRLATQARYGARIRHTRVRAPLFILGYWRSGTTLLHDLFCQDPRFGWPNHYEAFHPHGFLLTEDLARRALQDIAPAPRAQDNVVVGPFTAAEDDFALVSLTRHALYNAYVFPEFIQHYQRYLSLESLTADELASWKRALDGFLRRVSLRHEGKPLVLKSPGHTSRIRTLLELYPDARFVKIHRNPFEVFQSMVHTRVVVSRVDPQDPELAQGVLDNYRHAHEAFFAQRSLIPDGRYCEVAYADLASDPLSEMRRIYSTLGLDDFSEAEPVLGTYARTLKGFRRNRHVDLSQELVARIRREWEACFVEWGYPLEPAAAAG